MSFIDNLLGKVEEIFSLSPETSGNKVPDYSEHRGIKGEDKKEMVKKEPLTIKIEKFEDSAEIVRKLKEGHPILVSLEDLEYEIAKKTLDFLSGATYALEGYIDKIEKKIFLFIPKEIEVDYDLIGLSKGALSRKEKLSLYGE